jgi:peptidyl-prolyl cis-trans isomerase D
MLQAIHDRVMGVVGWIVLGLLIITFAFFGLNSYLKTGGGTYAAKVNDVEISQDQYKRAYDQMLARVKQAMGDKFDPDAIKESELRQSALTKLINEELIVQAADNAGLAASDSLLATQLTSVEAFKNDGTFSKERYAQTLRYQGMTPAQFEWRLGREIIANQLKSGIIDTSAGPLEQLRRAYSLQGQKRRFNYIQVPETVVSGNLSISEQDARDFYQAHPDQFKTAERVKVQYLELNAAELNIARAVDEEQVKALYEEHHDKYVTPEQRHARHILVAVHGDSEADIKAAQTRAEEISKRLDKGEDFVAIAGKESDDTASAASGGDLGTFGKGVMVPEVENAIFSMKVGERSKPVKSSFGFHIIELLGIEPEVATPLDQVRNELVEELQSSERNDMFTEKQETLANLTFEQPDSLQGAATELDLKIQETDWITRAGGAGIANNPKVVAAAFSDDVLKNGNNSGVIETGDDQVIVLRVVDHQQAALPPFEEVRAAAMAAARKDRISTLLTDRGQGYLEGLESGKTGMDTIAKELGLKIEYNVLLPRSSQYPSAYIIERAFALQRPELNKPVFDGFLQPDGGYVLLDLEEVQDGKFDELPEATRKQAQRSMNELQGISEMEMVLDDLESEATINKPVANSP